MYLTKYICVCRFVAGVIAREKLLRFEQVLWRACRGNVFVQQTEIDEPLEDPSTVSKCNKHLSTFKFHIIL